MNNAGDNDRDLFNTSLKLDFGLGGGTLTSVTAYDTTEEILTGDAYDFRPRPNAVFAAIYGTDLNQSQWLKLDSWSQEVRFTSAPGERGAVDRGCLPRAHRPFHIHRQHDRHGRGRISGVSHAERQSRQPAG